MYSLILHGRRSLELQKCCNMRVSVQNAFAFSNSFTSAYATDVRSQDDNKGHIFTVSYLVASLGLTRKLAESIWRNVSFEEKSNPDSVLNLLRSHGFTDSQISSVITDYPLLLVLDAEKSLGPKLEFLQSREGASSSELTEILSKVPKILGKDRAMSIYYDFVKEIIVADKSVKFKKVVEMGFDPTTSKFVQALKVVYTMSDKSLEEKVNIYKSLGFDVVDVWEIFKKWPFSLKFSDKKVTQTFETLKRCGLEEEEVRLVFNKFPQFVSVSEQNILNSTEAFLGLGFSRDEFAMMVKRFPMCILLSTKTVKKKAEFIVKIWPRKAVVSMPAVLGLSMEKRIVPRCNVIKALMSKGLLGSEIPPMSSVLAITNQAFLEKYVKKRNDKKLVAELMTIFTRKEDKNLCLN